MAGGEADGSGDFASDWIKAASASDIVYLPVDQVRFDWLGRQVNLDDLGISSTVDEIRRTKVWSPQYPAYATKMRYGLDCPLVGPSVVMLNGNHRLMAIQNSGIELPKGIPVRVGPPLASEDERCIVAAKINDQDNRFRKYTVAETLLAIDSVCGRVLSRGQKLTTAVVKEHLLGTRAEEAHRMMDRWYTTWGELFNRGQNPEERKRLRAQLRFLCLPQVAFKVKWVHLRLKQKNAPFEVRLRFLSDLYHRYATEKDDDDDAFVGDLPGEDEAGAATPKTVRRHSERRMSDIAPSDAATPRSSGRATPRKRRKTDDWGTNYRWHTSQRKSSRVQPKKRVLPATAPSSSSSSSSEEGRERERSQTITVAGHFTGSDSLRSEITRLTSTLLEEDDVRVGGQNLEAFQDNIMNALMQRLNRSLWD